MRYDRAFLGRKTRKDPPLAGRADYICDATSYGRWAVEVKSPSYALTQDEVEQAHTYCAHPEISAAYFLLTNGREFRLYATARLADPLLAWVYDDTEQHMMTLFNIVSYGAIRKLTEATKPDVNKPLGAGLPSTVRIIGGEVTYGEHRSTHPLLGVDALKGTVAAITGLSVARATDGRLHARVSIRSPYQQLADLNKLAGLDDYEFYCSDEYISSDIEHPTIFQNVVEGRLEPGAKAKLLPGLPEIALPIGFQFTVYTEATGYVSDEAFEGMLSFHYDYQFIRGRPTGNPQIDRLLFGTPPTAVLEGTGKFKVLFGPAKHLT